ncbi:MAG: acyltransferase [Planctomycetes bacterium]|nr:acyltransferase [Planctomycetota bacterium]
MTQGDAPPTPRRDLPALTGVRALAALWVLVFHAQWFGLWEAFPSLRPLEPLVRVGYLGVDLFFVLSGFILTHTYADEFRALSGRGYLRYLAARLARIYPVHLFVLAVMVPWVAAARLGWFSGPWAGDRFRIPDLAVHVGLLQSWGLASRPAWNVPSWSISAEWFAYLWFPLTCAALLKVRSGSVAIVGSATAVAATIGGVRLLGGQSLSVDDALGLVRVSGEFLAGALACRAAIALRNASVPWGAVALAATGAVIGLPFVGLGDPWAVFAFVALILALSNGRGVLAQVLATRPAVFAGRISYSMYMVHAPVFGILAWAVGRHVDPAWSGAWLWCWIALYAAAPVVVAIAVWRWIEEPSRVAIRRWTDRRLPAEPRQPTE